MKLSDLIARLQMIERSIGKEQAEQVDVKLTLSLKSEAHSITAVQEKGDAAEQLSEIVLAASY